MPFGMWTLFVLSFRNQLTAVFGYGTNTNCSALKKDAESLPRPQNYLAFHLFYSSTLSVTLLHLINRIADFINLLVKHSLLSLCGDWDFLKLRVRHDNTVIVTCRNP